MLATLVFQAEAIGTAGEANLILSASGMLHARKCESICDCYKNSGSFDIDTMHMCMECSHTKGDTCHTIAKCPVGQMCTVNPSTGQSELACILPLNLAQSCLSDQDCTFSYYHSDKAPNASADFTTITRERQMRTFSGSCLPSGKCRYLPYGVLTDNSAIQHSLTPLDHATCRPKVASSCRTTEDCFYLGKSQDTIQNPYIACDAATSTCTDSAPVETRPATTGIACQTEQDCYDHSIHNDLTTRTSCYACVKAAVPHETNDNNFHYNISKVCVKTSSTCSSGMCMNGQCIGKMCQSHVDCIEIGGVTRHSHQCDYTTGMCSARFICPYGSYCTLDHGKEHRCSVLINPCDLAAPESKLMENAKNDLYCIPMGRTGRGYYRLTNKLFTLEGNDGKMTTAAAGGPTKSIGIAPRLISAYAKHSTHLSLENSVFRRIQQVKEEAFHVANTVDVLPERPVNVKVTQRPPVQVGQTNAPPKSATTVQATIGEDKKRKDSVIARQQPKVKDAADPVAAPTMPPGEIAAYVILIVIAVIAVPLLIIVMVNTSKWVKMKFEDKHGNTVVKYVKADDGDSGSTQSKLKGTDKSATRRKKTYVKM